MKKLLWLLPVIGALLLLTQSCSDSAVESTKDKNEEKKEEILEKANSFLPDNLIQIFGEQIDRESANIDKQEYLDTLNVEIVALVDSINKHSSLEEFKRLIQEAQSEANKLLSNTSGINKSMSCTNNFGLGFSKGGEVYGEATIGAGAGVISQLNARGGGGMEFIYDFVNMDRGVYTYSFCGIGGANVGVGGGFSASVGFTGLRKWLWNIKPNQLSTKDRFEGASRAYSIGLSASFVKFVGLEASADAAYIQELSFHSGQEGIIQNLTSCPSYFGTPPIRDGVKELSFSVSAGGGIGAEIIAALKGEIIGSNRTFVEDGYTDYSVNKWGRQIAGIRMAKDLLTLEPYQGIKTGGSAPGAAAIVTLLSLFNPSDCPAPNQVPDISDSEIIEVKESNATVRVNISDDGGSPVTDRGLCWSTESYPTKVNVCKSEGNGRGEFTSTINELNPDTQYYVRAFATNSIGTAYGDQRNFTTKADDSDGARDTETEVVDVTNPKTGKTWMDRNLGASRAATSSTDEQAYGDLYQWGRAADGHQNRNSSTTSTQSNTDTPGHGRFILSNADANYDWRSPQNNNLWQGVDGINNPCPEEYRLPTEAEWKNERQSWNNDNAKGASMSPLKVSLAGSRELFDGSLSAVGSFGVYWSATAQGKNARFLRINNEDVTVASINRAFGASVRCIKEGDNNGGSSPTITTKSISVITYNSAISGGNVSDDGGATVTERGVCWSTSQNPTTSDDCTSDGSGTGSFTSNLTNLSSDTRYYVRAYATNNVGTAYGSQRNFTTDSGQNDDDWPRDTETEVVDVTNPKTGKTWMDRNLGASRAATSSTDEQAYGDLYQWGRAADSHQYRNSPTTYALSSSDQPGHGSFIIALDSPYDWRSPQNDNLWQDVNGINNPCPEGYRLPTAAEWDTERESWSSNNGAGAFDSPLKLPLPGSRFGRTGSLVDVGSVGRYWFSSVASTYAQSTAFSSSTASMGSSYRAGGRSVRCIKN